MRTRSPTLKRDGRAVARTDGDPPASAAASLSAVRTCFTGAAGPFAASAFDLVRRSKSGLDDQRLEPGEPQLVIGLRKVVRGRARLPRPPRHVDIPHAGRTHRECQAHHPPLPVGVKQRLVGLWLHGTEALHAAHVVRSVHAAPSVAVSAGVSGSPVPIIESRVTSVARRASSQPSVPAGRSGMTR